jgi:hypothetical protein
MRILLVIAAALALAAPASSADLRTLTVVPTEDVSIPYWCEWGYDWDERCYRLNEDRLAVGGDTDKVWRSALRFAIPQTAVIYAAELSLWYDGTCLSPLKTSRRCDGRQYDFALHPIFTSRWSAEREVEIGPVAAIASLPAFAAPQWLEVDVTDLAAEWASDGLSNRGVLVKLADGQEDFGVSGPLFPSSRSPLREVRPRLRVVYSLG